MTNDRNVSVSLGCVAATSLWVGAVALLAIGTWTGDHTPQNWGLVISAGAATATIRQYFVNWSRSMRNAYLLGRDSASSESVVRLRER